jgi:fructokinase
LDGAKLFYFGGVALTDDPARSTALAAAAEARRRGLLIAYDPNYRPLLWKEDAARVLKQGLQFADVLKVSDLECQMLSGEENLEAGSALLSEQYDIPLVFVTLGPKGAAFRFGSIYRQQPTFDVKTVDTTGAGDSFFGSVLYRILRTGKRVNELSSDEIDEFMRFANAAGSLVTTKKGAVCSMPDLGQIQALLTRAG